MIMDIGVQLSSLVRCVKENVAKVTGDKPMANRQNDYAYWGFSLFQLRPEPVLGDSNYSDKLNWNIKSINKFILLKTTTDV